MHDGCMRSDSVNAVLTMMMLMSTVLVVCPQRLRGRGWGKRETSTTSSGRRSASCSGKRAAEDCTAASTHSYCVRSRTRPSWWPRTRLSCTYAPRDACPRNGVVASVVSIMCTPHRGACASQQGAWCDGCCHVSLTGGTGMDTVLPSCGLEDVYVLTELSESPVMWPWHDLIVAQNRCTEPVASAPCADLLQCGWTSFTVCERKPVSSVAWWESAATRSNQRWAVSVFR